MQSLACLHIITKDIQLTELKQKTRVPHVGTNTQLQCFKEILCRKRGIIMSKKKKLRVTCPTGMGSPFDSKLLI